MIDSFIIPLIVLAMTAAGGVASVAAHRRRSRQAPPDLSTLSQADLLAVLASLQHQPTNPQIIAQPPASQAITHSISAMHAASRIREADHPKSVSSIEQNHDVRRRITLLILDEIERRQVRTER